MFAKVTKVKIKKLLYYLLIGYAMKKKNYFVSKMCGNGKKNKDIFFIYLSTRKITLTKISCDWKNFKKKYF